MEQIMEIISPETKEKIKIEKRKRYQVYTSLNYLMSAVSYFDFFSLDTFKISKKAKYIAQSFNKKEVTSEFLLLPFFETESDISKILEIHNIKNIKVEELISFLNKKQLEKTHIFKQLSKKIFNSKLFFNKKLKFSYETNLIFEKAAENALNRFKTPVITPEILFLTLLEEKNSRVGKLLKNIIKTDTEWLVLRFKILKKLHNQEVEIRREVSVNQQYFAYLLKIQLSDKEFEKLLEKKVLENSVSLFRNLLVLEILNVNIFNVLLKDIKHSIRLNNTRKYSS